MTEWGVVGVLVTLLGLAVSIVTPIIRLTRTIAMLTAVMEGLKETVDKNREENRASHQRLWEHNAEQDNTINDHETRITVLEKSEERHV